ncbi:unnamed protein product [marine sediment metagenome]|uniref:Uncharacterized protein n=1 Tax=marine sediment metagenome TaxID=412755 RepID=X1EWK4_9ZZZZ
MSGITDPTEEYFKDGGWGWDATDGEWKKLLVDDLGRLEVVMGARGYAHYQTNAEQPIPNNAPTIVDYEIRLYDPDVLVTIGAAWKCTPKVAGYYHATAALAFETTVAWADGENAFLFLYKNGATFEAIDFKENYNALSAIMQLSGSTDIYMNGTTDFIDIRVQQVTGAALNLHISSTFNYVAIHRI